MKKAFLLLSGFNDRTVVSLCRCFTQHNLPFSILARDARDLILQTDYANRVIQVRDTPELSIQALAEATQHVRRQHTVDDVLLCSTSEFLNMWAFEHRDNLASIGLELPQVSHEQYLLLTSKLQLGQSLAKNLEVSLPPAVDPSAPCLPCVLKPKQNVVGNHTLYPKICFTESDWREATQDTSFEQYFAQKFIVGRSFYLCYYMGKDGRYVCYSQRNLIQQPGGKSIVAAEVSCDSDGQLAKALAAYLYSVQFFGPVMFEFIEDNSDAYFIEANPRFWGPLQLAFTAAPEFFDLFIEDTLGLHVKTRQDTRKKYIWYFGARQFWNNLWHYLGDDEQAHQLIEANRHCDIYGSSDTRRLHERA